MEALFHEAEVAISRGVCFLESVQLSCGLWVEFDTKPGSSDEWVTAFIASHIARINGVNTLLGNALRALERRSRPDGGWGYNASVSADCDSTAWVLLAFLSGAYVRPVMIRRAVDFLYEHQLDDGGFATFRETRSRSSRKRGKTFPPTGWLRSQTCVTAAAILALLAHGESANDPRISSAVDYLIDRQSFPGGWSSYWWHEDAYASYHALLALTWACNPKDHDLNVVADRMAASLADDVIAAADDDLRERILGASYILLTLLLVPDTEEARKAIMKIAGILIEEQQPDGSWPTAPVLLIPESRPGVTELIGDTGRAFTTSVALKAVNQFRNSSLMLFPV